MRGSRKHPVSCLIEKVTSSQDDGFVGVLTKNIPKKFCGELEMQKTSAFSDWRVRNCAVVFESSQFSRSSKRNSKCGEETHGSFLFMLWSRDWFESGSVSGLRYPSARNVAAGPEARIRYRNGRARRRRRNQREVASAAPVVAFFTQLRVPSLLLSVWMRRF